MQACHANPGANKKLAGSSPYISIHLSLKFSNTSQAITYYIEHTNHDIHQGFLFQILPICFYNAHNLYH